MNNYFNIKYGEGFLEFIDQTKLPFHEEYIRTDDYEVIAQAIEKLEVRGAPAIGIAAAFGLALSQKFGTSQEVFRSAYDRLYRTRPTAVNLFTALDQMRETYNKLILESYGIEFIEGERDRAIFFMLEEKAKAILIDDVKRCENIAKNGLEIFSKKSNVLTHCNTGKLATGGDGTAFAVIKKAFEAGFVEHVYVDETRPLLQGSRLTAYELYHAGIPFSIITDSAAGFLMQQGKVDLVITGADRIASNGDAANKIGTYSLAVLANFHKIPFYIAAPKTTVDSAIPSLDKIPIEFRSDNELCAFGNEKITRAEYSFYNPAFDKIPSKLITKIITD